MFETFKLSEDLLGRLNNSERKELLEMPGSIGMLLPERLYEVSDFEIGAEAFVLLVKEKQRQISIESGLMVSDISTVNNQVVVSFVNSNARENLKIGNSCSLTLPNQSILNTNVTSTVFQDLRTEWSSAMLPDFSERLYIYPSESKWREWIMEASLEQEDKQLKLKKIKLIESVLKEKMDQLSVGDLDILYETLCNY